MLPLGMLSQPSNGTSTDAASLPWRNLPIDPSDPSLGTASHATSIPYLPKGTGNRLQTLDLCLLSAPTPPFRPPNPDKSYFLIYIHGGAWRDPAQTSTTFEGAQAQLLRLRATATPTAPIRSLWGFATLNYSLSAYPTHATDPSDPSDPARNAVYPQHLNDVVAAIHYLQRLLSFGDNYILVGHSCGATLALEALDSGRLFGAPRAVVGLAGLYNLPLLVHHPGPVHERWRDLYGVFMRSAFGDNEEVWRLASPAQVRQWGKGWDAPLLAATAYSNGDTLVPPNQEEAMVEGFREGGWKGEYMRLHLTGDHDVWRFGAEQIAEVVRKVVERLFEIEASAGADKK